eukprot:6751927-Karenia_brevis.AAC.1
MLLRRAVTKRQDGKGRELMFIDVKKAHLNQVCEEDVDLELPEECHCPPGFCGKFVYWMYGMRGTASSWEKCHADKFSNEGFSRGVPCG